MKKISVMLSLCACIALSSCNRSSNEIWDDTRSAGRYFARGIKSLRGGATVSQQVRYKDEFYSDPGFDLSEEFIALQDDSGQNMIRGENVPQAKDLPGDPGTGLPSIDSFQDPADDPKLSKVFRHVHFPYDSSLVKGDENTRIVQIAADYLKANRNIYIFVEGHADERGSEAYNLPLGTRRANAVRNLLVKEGVNPEHIFTISYGKERPLVVGRDETTWGLNRRVQFKVFAR